MSMNPLFLPAENVPTMTSLEVVDFINQVREQKASDEAIKYPCSKYPKLLHKNFLQKVPKVLGLSSAKFLADDNFATGKGAVSSRQIYKFPKREACLMAMSYDYDAQARVFDRMIELEERLKSEEIQISVSDQDFHASAMEEYQHRLVLLEQRSFREHGQKGSGLMQLRKKEKKELEAFSEKVKKLSQLTLPGIDDENRTIQ
ncbi:Rha family transcriptional regulator [Pantoea sp. Al-1710]|uniref:Rha family transcriptional regulator n=1 Tax=Candidatus Pantoea communis TaxID=2608354 RepID=A0ABX0RI17_9GAMM|nr:MULTISPECIES: Rha family transcriptional regulator [Pantoea]NIG13004.1 Rha family transcriptional regulator [Pantoea sp. Cy-640]NIG17295.1 Rha family transcriptional regulator [Pantoea communis]